MPFQCFGPGLITKPITDIVLILSNNKIWNSGINWDSTEWMAFAYACIDEHSNASAKLIWDLVLIVVHPVSCKLEFKPECSIQILNYLRFSRLMGVPTHATARLQSLHLWPLTPSADTTSGRERYLPTLEKS